jgi:DNA-binding winged helix-turn-helix (wHTH) protein/TolB-like protein/Tfp pilus assembly protein PilF
MPACPADVRLSSSQKTLKIFRMASEIFLNIFRSHVNDANLCIFDFGDFRLDAARRLLLKGDDRQPVKLTSKAFDTLLYMVLHAGTIVSKDELMRAVWPDTVVEENNLSQNVFAIRRALGEKQGENRYIATVPGRGFNFVAAVTSLTGGDTAAVTEGAVPEVGLEAVSRVIIPVRDQSAFRWTRLGIVVGLIMAALGGAAYYGWRVSTVPVMPVRVMAVLPFKPLLVENRDETLELGMADALITKLSNLRRIIVRPLASARRYGGIDQDPLAAGRELQVDSVLDGSIQRLGDRIRVTARLVGIGGEQLWAGQFDEKFTDIFAVQDAISGRVAGALALHLGGEEERRLAKHYTDNAAAYELYLTGRYHLFKLTPTEVRKAAGFFQEAVAADPPYALAYTGIADAYRTLPITSDVPPKDAFPKATEAVTKALQLDDSLAEAHAIRGWIKFWFDWDWAASESNFRRAIDLDPNNADAHRGYAHLLSNTGRHEEALREVEKARELDPLSLITNTLQGQFLRFAGHDDEAERSFEKALELDSNFWVAHINLANVLIEKKMYAQALTHLAKAREQSGGNTQTLSITAYALALAGERERARGLLEDLRRMSGERYVPPYNLGMVHHGLGEREEALDWLEKAFDGRDVLLTFVAVDPKWDAFRSDQRFVSLLQRMNLRN